MAVKRSGDQAGLEEAPPHYHGHRERLRARFREAGSDAVTDYELLELVLFRAMPRRDIKPLAKSLIGKFGSFARGFFVGNSEVGKTSLFAGFFLFDYVCCNRIVWGADQYTEVRIRHTKGAPDRWLEEVTPVLREYSQASAKPVVQAIEDARSKRIDDELTTFLAKRFGKAAAPAIMAVHEQEEGRPIETLWDVTVAATAHARSVKNTDKRLEIERTAGELLKLAA